jgi:hypothetical protein
LLPYLKLQNQKTMKRVLLVLAVASVMVACNNKKKGGDDKKPADTSATTNNNTNTNTNTNPAVPTFADPDVQAYVNAYEEYITAYEKVVESKDMTKMMDLSKTAQDLAAKGTAAAQKLSMSPEEAKKLSDYMTARSQYAVELSKKLTGQ